jgi:hypothetical protein
VAAPATEPSRRSIFVASFIGTAIEWYDYYIFGLAAALVFGHLLQVERGEVEFEVAFELHDEWDIAQQSDEHVIQPPLDQLVLAHVVATQPHRQLAKHPAPRTLIEGRGFVLAVVNDLGAPYTTIDAQAQMNVNTSHVVLEVQQSSEVLIGRCIADGVRECM